MSRKAASVLLFASVVGCVHEYHPEFHPETSYSYVQNIVTVIPPPAPVVLTPALPAVASAFPVSRALADDMAGDPFVVRPRNGLAPETRTTHAVVRARAPARDVQYAPVFVADDGR
jgi:hypothetical protein